MFTTVLVANRGEIAVRVIATLRRMGIRSVAVYSDADLHARHVREADVAVRLGPALASESYLNIDRILDAARLTGADAIHPGYGFLSENAEFARACESAGVVFVGPSADVVDLMGDKIQAKLVVQAAGVAVVPGRATPGMSDADLVAAAGEIGYPVMVKPSAGGGGKGMRVVSSPDEITDALVSARREAAASFGDDTLFLERFVTEPRHIEVQILADHFGDTVHLGERECSLQRRHQKVIEEAPSVLLDASTRTRICESAVAIAKAVDYRGVGTVEFIVSARSPDEYFFMEMNTRLQVEHPVTEFVTGLDLVEQQLRVASGERLQFAQGDVRVEGHAIEARVYAEDPNRGFLPTGGRVLVLREPSGADVRVDSSLVEGEQISTNYDPMVSKVIAYGPSRSVALARLDSALANYVVLGVTTNTEFLRALLAAKDVREGRLDTGLIERELTSLVSDHQSASQVPDDVYAAYGLAQLLGFAPVGPWVNRWEVADGWRVGDHSSTRWILASPDRSRIHLGIRGTANDAVVEVERSRDDGVVIQTSVRASASGVVWSDNARSFLLTVDDRSHRVDCVADDDVTWLWVAGRTYHLRSISAARQTGVAGGGDGELRSPMPGIVIDVSASAGQTVQLGERLVVIEAMKMENALAAPFSGTVAEVLVSVGEQVVVDQLLARIHPAQPES